MFVLLPVTCRNAPTIHAAGGQGDAHARIWVAGLGFTLPA
jgi:hypothetical protein